jgi:hypothetical protein
VKAFNRFWIWLGLPALLAASAYLQNADLARVAAVLMWGTLLAIGFACTLSLVAVLLMKPTDEKWAENKVIWLKEKRGVFAKAVSWVSLLVTVGLAAFTGFAVTAVCYFLVSLWTRLAVTLIETHFTKAEPASK